MNLLDPNNADDIKSIQKVRNIHKEIVDFGINQKEILKLIEFLSMEIEEISLMKKIISFLKEENKDHQEKKENKILI